MTAPVPAGSALTLEDPWLRRFGAWASDRFPVALAVLNVVLYTAAVSVGVRVAGTAADAMFWWQTLAGFFAFWSFSLTMRIYDEHKDYTADSVNHPDRVLQRGLVTLGQLRMLAAGALVLQLGVCIWIDGGIGPVTAMWLVATAYSVLTAFEFFAGEWLERRLVLYAVLHGVVMPLVVFWAVTIGARSYVVSDPAVLLLGVEALLSAFAFEVTRKIKAPQEERGTVDSYTKIWGTRGAPMVAAALLTLAGGTLVALITVLGAPAILAVVLVVVAVAVTAAVWAPFLRFARRPEPAYGSKLEAAAGIHLLTACVLVAIAALSS